MSFETYILSRELEALDEARRQLNEAYMALRSRVKNFLEELNEFSTCLSEFSSKIVAAFQIEYPPPVPLELLAAAEQKEQEAKQLTLQLPPSEKAFTWEKAVVVAVAVAGTAVVVQNGLLPPLALMGVVGAGFTFTFWSQIRDALKSLAGKVEEGEEEKLNVEEWAIEQLNKLRTRCLSAFKLAQVQNQTLENLPSYYKSLGVDKSFVERRKYFEDVLPAEFLSVIDEVMIKCNQVLWHRRTVIYNALTIVKQAGMMQRGGG